MNKANLAANRLRLPRILSNAVLHVGPKCVALFGVSVFLSAPGCDRAATGGGQTATPSSDVSINDRGDGANERESREKLTQSLAGSYEKFNKARAMGTETPEVCRQLCDISTSICEMQEKVCDIAERNPSSIESVDSCRWAKNRCCEVSKHCTKCTQKFQQNRQP